MINPNNRLERGVSHIILILFVILILLPIYWMLVSAVETNDNIFSPRFHLLPLNVDWGNFVQAWRAEPFGIFFVNSIVSNLLIVFFQVITSSMAAYALAFTEFKAKKTIFFLILMAMMIPMQATFIPVYIMLSKVHLINTYGALVIPFIGSAFGIFLLRQGFVSVPKEMVQAARIDGASEFRILWSIVLPNVKPAIVTLVLLNFVFHYNSLFWPLVTTNSTNMRVIPVALSYFLSQDAGQQLQWNLLMAADLFSIVPVIAIFLFGQKYIVKGVANTSLKG
jgi:ABC-type glycerol-3-phosphate transport system permease component